MRTLLGRDAWEEASNAAFDAAGLRCLVRVRLSTHIRRDRRRRQTAVLDREPSPLRLIRRLRLLLRLTSGHGSYESGEERSGKRGGESKVGLGVELSVGEEAEEESGSTEYGLVDGEVQEELGGSPALLDESGVLVAAA